VCCHQPFLIIASLQLPPTLSLHLQQGAIAVSICEKEETNLTDFGIGSAMLSYILYGDSLLGLKEFKRALVYYKRALHYHATSTHKKVLTPPADVVAQLRYKMTQCLIETEAESNCARAAITMMEGIPPAHRTLCMLMLLGKLYQESGMDASATTTYKAALELNPCAIEAMMALIDLGVSSADISNYLEELGEENRTWMRAVIEAHECSSRREEKEALRMYQDLNTVFPSNSYIMLQQAHCQFRMKATQGGIYTYNKVHAEDVYCVDQMDEYASLLRSEERGEDLNRLAHELIAVDSNRPQTWVAVALYSDLKGEKEKAIAFLDKAIALDKRHVPSYHLKGQLLLQLGQPEHAVRAHWKGYSLRKDMTAFSGLVKSYLRIPKYKEALCSAKEAMKSFPYSAQALTLVGEVLIQIQDGKEKAKRVLEKALQLDPMCLQACLLLSDLEVEYGLLDIATKRLKQALVHHKNHIVHCKLADVFSKKRVFADALTHYNNALSLSPQYSPAIAGYERLEKLMRGEDPDAEETDPEGDDA
jgi:anaphase-promoting complex subunit 7